MPTVLRICLIVVGLIHLLPLSGVLGVERLQALYALAWQDEGLTLLLRHRAVLFGLLGALLIASAWVPALRAAALWAGWISVLSFLWLALDVGTLNPAMMRVVIADLVAVVALSIASVLHWRGVDGVERVDDATN